MHAKPDSTPFLWAILAGAVFVSFFLNIHNVPLFDLDEGAFSEATREMFRRGDFISTYLNGSPRYDKPILIYWLQALSILVFGFGEFALRLPSALAATAWVLVIFAFVRRLKDGKTALYAALLTATTLQISIIGKAAIADALLNLLLTTTMFSIYLYYRERSRGWLYLSFACMALGFLTKGPIAVLIPFAVSLIFFAAKRELRAWAGAALDIRGIGLFLLIALPWYGAQYLKEGQAFIEGFFFTHNLGRFQGPMQGHGGSLLYYFPVVLIGLLPYTSLLVKTCANFRTTLRDDFNLYLLVWSLFVFIFFSLSGTKLPHYVIYGYPAILVLMAGQLDRFRSRFWALLPALVFFLFLLGLPEIIPLLRPSISDAFARDVLADAPAYFSGAYRLFFGAAILLVLYLMSERRIALAHKLVLVGVITVAALSVFLVPIIGRIQQQPIKEAALLSKKAGYQVVMWRLNTPSFMVYSERLVEKRRPRPGDVVLTKRIYLSALPGYKILYAKNGIVLVKVGGKPVISGR